MMSNTFYGQKPMSGLKADENLSVIHRAWEGTYSRVDVLPFSKGAPSFQQIQEFIDGKFCDFNRNEKRGSLTLALELREIFAVQDYPIGYWLTFGEIFGRQDLRIAGARFVTGSRRMSNLLRSHDLCAPYESMALYRASQHAHPEKNLERLIIEARVKAGHKVQSQVRFPFGVIDIVDHTERSIIECKWSNKRYIIRQAVRQLRRYAPAYPDYTAAIALPTMPENAQDTAILNGSGIAILTRAAPIGPVGAAIKNLIGESTMDRAGWR